MAFAEEPDLDRIKRMIADVARTVGIPTGVAGDQVQSGQIRRPNRCELSPQTENVRSAERLTTAIAWVRARDERDRIFGADLFFDPAWNMLLDLYISERRSALVAVSSLCIAAKVPSITALRWLAMLEKRELISRRADEYDRRRSFLFLTAEARAKIEATLDRASESNGKLGIGLLSRLN